jgi:hypothetical protein
LLVRRAHGASAEPAGDRSPPPSILPAAPVTNACLSPRSIPIGSTRIFNSPPPGRLFPFLVPLMRISPSVTRRLRRRCPAEMRGWHYAIHPPSSTPLARATNRAYRRDRSPSAPPGFVLGPWSTTKPATAKPQAEPGIAVETSEPRATPW